MAMYVIDSNTLDGLGDAIRSVTGSTKKYKPSEMIDEVTNILNAATFILVDKDGNEYPAVYVDSDVEFTATANDIRLGKTAITGEGVIEGTKEIPSYYTTEGVAIAPVGSTCKIVITNCEYTKLQALICRFNTSLNDSVETEKVSINGLVYEVNSTEVLSDVIVDPDTMTISFGVKNEGTTPYIIRFFTYKEVI